MGIDKNACFCGHRTARMPEGYELEKLEMKLFNEIDKAVSEGYENFLFGACYGFDFLAARQVLLRKKIQKGNELKRIRLIAILSCEEQANDWSEASRNEFFEILAQCDNVYTLHRHTRREHYRECGRAMIDHSSRLICYYIGGKGGTGRNVFYAKAKGIDIVNLHPVLP